MERQHKPFTEIQDLIGLRLITDSVENCYALLDLVHRSFKQVPGSFTDYISVPKMNMYQSLHTSIFGPNDLLAEIQIRTEEMHRWAEYGIAAHWRYKERGGRAAAALRPEDFDDKMDWLKQVLEWQQDVTDGKEFIAAFKVECTFDQIFVSTPQGKVVKLPLGATPLDFSYAVHSEIGNHSYGAKVGTRMVPLDYHLKSGETCTILTRKSAHPNKGWLQMAITARARSRIRKYLRDCGEKI
jgi:GTP pyrophosphokinase